MTVWYREGQPDQGSLSDFGKANLKGVDRPAVQVYTARTGPLVSNCESPLSAVEVDMKDVAESAKNKHFNHQEIIHDSVVALFYPGMLGAIIVGLFSFVNPHFSFSIEHLPYIALGMVLIFHYTIDYLYTIYIERYGVIPLLLDMLVIGAMFVASQSVDIGEKAYSHSTISIIFTATYVVFALIDITTTGGIRFFSTVTFDLTMVAIFVLEFIYFERIETLTAAIFFGAIGLLIVGPKPMKGEVVSKIVSKRQ
jgi:hypothetical protein